MKLANKQKQEILKTAKAKHVKLRMLEAGLGVSEEIDEARYEYVTGHKYDGKEA